jgi:hypothetical protein
VVRVDTDTEMEGILAGNLGHVLVDDDTGSFQSLRANLLLLTRAQVNAEREVFYRGILTSHIVDSDLGVCNGQEDREMLTPPLILAPPASTQWSLTRNTSAVSRLNVGLVLAIAVAAGRSYSGKENDPPHKNADMENTAPQKKKISGLSMQRNKRSETSLDPCKTPFQ